MPLFNSQDILVVGAGVLGLCAAAELTRRGHDVLVQAGAGDGSALSDNDFKAAGAAIVNTGSVTGLFGSPELIDYSATKGAIHAFTKALAANLLDRGIRVNAVAPGPVWTPFNPADRPAAEVAEFGRDSAMRRPAQPEELSPAYVFLASPVTAGYVNGIVLPVTGGPKG